MVTLWRLSVSSLDALLSERPWLTVVRAIFKRPLGTAGNLSVRPPTTCFNSGRLAFNADTAGLMISIRVYRQYHTRLHDTNLALGTRSTAEPKGYKRDPISHSSILIQLPIQSTIHYLQTLPLLNLQTDPPIQIQPFKMQFTTVFTFLAVTVGLVMATAIPVDVPNAEGALPSRLEKREQCGGWPVMCMSDYGNTPDFENLGNHGDEELEFIDDPELAELLQEQEREAAEEKRRQEERDEKRRMVMEQVKKRQMEQRRMEEETAA
ncbi:hypothetical protein BJ508DRAFT_331765 [Ascobolus immersus RN42]|uniref:Uncharacterized protein n=1 Tax=Ascobolus immersus RN42 TaxID=1160509 RepID=A0A3N4HPU9_ASCIM|nr:hypothetical protein BJ508DRAFT_331765 [Ascobolus immersus RN42]